MDEHMDTSVQETDTQTPELESMAIPTEKYADNPNIAKYKTVGDLIKGHAEAVKLVGAKGVLVPGDNAKPEEIDKFYNTLGRPSKPEEYQFNKVEGLHEKAQISEEGDAAFKGVAHKLGLTTKQANGMREWYLKSASESLSKLDTQTVESGKEAETKLRREWGSDFETNVTGVKRMIEKFGGEEGLKGFDVDTLGNNPAVLKTLANVMKMMSEDSFVKGGIDFTIDAGNAGARIKQLEADPAFMNENDPRHSAVVEERTRLYKIAYPV